MINAGEAISTPAAECFPSPAVLPVAAIAAAGDARDYSRLNRFLNLLGSQVYPEIPTGLHSIITRSIIAQLLKGGWFGAGVRLLDVGCGQGDALELFKKLGMEPVGITLGTDCDVCRAKGLDVRQMDQSFMTFAEGEFDFLWCRHVLEHSFAPLFTLMEYHRVTKAGGFVYVEVPAPGTYAHHETNPNHYSVLPMPSWLSLFGRAGFAVLQAFELNITTPSGPDTYWSFLLLRRAA